MQIGHYRMKICIRLHTFSEQKFGHRTKPSPKLFLLHISQMRNVRLHKSLSTAKKKNQFSIFYGYNVSKSVNKMLNQAMNDIWTSPSVSQPCFWTSVFQVLGLNLVVMDLVYLCIMPVSLIYESTELGQVNLSGKHRQRSWRPFQWQTRRSSLYP